MNTSETFQQNFGDKIKSELSEIEQLRKKTSLKISVIWILCITVSVCVSGFLLTKIYQQLKGDEEFVQAMLIACGLLLAFIFTFLFTIQKKIARNYLYKGEYVSRYKKEIIGKAIPAKFHGLVYDSENGISKTDFIESGFPTFDNVSRYYSSGKIQGKRGETSFTFSEVVAEEYQESSDLGSGGQYVDLFRGMFFIVDLKKNITQRTLVYPDIMKYFKFAFINGNYKRIKLEDPEFEKNFEVYGTSQTESRYILSPALMARMVDFRKNTGKYIQISFKDSKAYFGIFLQGKDLFKPPLFTSVYNSKNIENYFDNVQLMIDIIKELNLNSTLMEPLTD